MPDYETAQTAQTYPTRTEVTMMLTIMALLIVNLVGVILANIYEPECVPAIMTTEEG